MGTSMIRQFLILELCKALLTLKIHNNCKLFEDFERQKLKIFNNLFNIKTFINMKFKFEFYLNVFCLFLKISEAAIVSKA